MHNDKITNLCMYNTIEVKLTASCSYEEALYLALQIKDGVNYSTEQIFYGMLKYSFPDSHNFYGHVCRFVCYSADHKIFQKVSKLTNIIMAKNLGDKNISLAHQENPNSIFEGRFKICNQAKSVNDIDSLTPDSSVAAARDIAKNESTFIGKR